MSIKPEDILDTASALIAARGDKGTEADFRSAASRAYYAALHAADAALPDDLALSDADRSTKDSHKAVLDSIILWAKSLRQGRTEAGHIARSLPRLKSARKKADYRLEDDFSKADAISAIATAEKTVASAALAGRQCRPQRATTTQ